MESYESIARAVNRNTKEIARELGLSQSTVSKWQEPPPKKANPKQKYKHWFQSGALNPADRLVMMMKKAIQLGVDPEDALAPLHYLNHEFGRIDIPVNSFETTEELSFEFVGTIKEFSHFSQAASEALENREILQQHARAIEREGNHLVRRALTFMRAAKEMTRKRFQLFTRKKEVSLHSTCEV
jgi:YesN/AraC family two-component response regulator